MPHYSAADVRRLFLDFFRERGHTIVPSSPVFPKDDPTLLFTNAGMNQFKDVFLGTGKRTYTRAADTQKCIRVSGKHNDLEEVGRDTYHHTFFEMLGNWSFGDYFKKEAIAWSWELLTKVYGLPKHRLWVTVFGGDEKDGLPADAEAERLWREVTDIAPDHILRFGRKDNFWEMGDTGPCGPCTEIHIDRGGPEENPEDGKNRAIGVNAGNERFMEIWNNVFIQFNRKEDGSLAQLPACHVDTGMGFERITAVVQGKNSNYATDLFTPIFEELTKLTGHRHGGTMDDRDVACRVIADHVRALTAAFSDGALPSNEGRGYVLRRLLRRAARFGRQALGQESPFIYRLVPVVGRVLGGAFPEMREREAHVMTLIEAEEKSFLLTLDKGIALFESVATSVENSKSRVIPGDAAYDLYATFGFPRDLVDLMARERDLSVDEAGWQKALTAHKEASRGEGTGKWLVSPEKLQGLPATQSACYADASHDGMSLATELVRLVDGKFLVLARTPFYAESGGQLGDAGLVEAPGFRFRVSDTKKMGDVVLHIGAVEVGSAEAPPRSVQAEVDRERRHSLMANHSATHLLHWALKSVLGSHANQQGSLVAPDRLRFDVTHPRAITAEEVERIETMVNDKVRQATPLATTVEDLQAAKARGVTALFGEKYDDQVRVVNIGGYSTELCGGTHCANTGQIGAFTIVSESAVQAGVRRIEAVTRGAAVSRMQESRRVLRELSNALKAGETDLLARVEALQEKVKELQRGGAKQATADLAQLAQKLLAEATPRPHGRFIVARIPAVPPAEVAALCDRLRQTPPATAGVLAMESEGKVVLAAFAAKELAGKVHAGDLVKQLAPLVGGGGGGRPDFAQAGGKDPSAIDAALTRATELLGASMSS